MNSNKKENKKKRECDFFYNFVKITGAIPALLWARQKVYHISDGKLVKGNKIKGRVLICSNHIGFTDPLLLNCIFWYRRVFFLAMQELFSTKLTRFFFNGMKCIPVDRSNFSMATFHAVTDRLKNDRAVLIFPEGQVNGNNSEILAFKSGAVLMATTSCAPLLPVYIVKREKWYHRYVVLIGDPVNFTDTYGARPSMQNMREASELLHSKEEELMRYYNDHIAKKQDKE